MCEILDYILEFDGDTVTGLHERMVDPVATHNVGYKVYANYRLDKCKLITKSDYEKYLKLLNKASSENKILKTDGTIEEDKNIVCSNEKRLFLLKKQEENTALLEYIIEKAKREIEFDTSIEKENYLKKIKEIGEKYGRRDC